MSPVITRTIKTLSMVSVLAFTGFAMAEPSRQEVDRALRAGDINQADTLMQEVVAAHPDSAKAHFKYAEILAAEGRIAQAKSELASAEKIEPGLTFARPEAVTALNNKLAHTQAVRNTSFNPLLLWGGLAIAGFLLVMVFRAFRRPQLQSAYNNPQVANAYGPQGAYPVQGNYSGPKAGGGIGSGIVGGLATGAAVGAGIVAGEMLMHNILDGDHPKPHDSFANQPAPDNYNDISGNDFVDNDNGSWDNDSSFDNDSSGDWS